MCRSSINHSWTIDKYIVRVGWQANQTTNCYEKIPNFHIACSLSKLLKDVGACMVMATYCLSSSNTAQPRNIAQIPHGWQLSHNKVSRLAINITHQDVHSCINEASSSGFRSKLRRFPKITFNEDQCFRVWADRGFEVAPTIWYIRIQKPRETVSGRPSGTLYHRYPKFRRHRWQSLFDKTVL